MTFLTGMETGNAHDYCAKGSRFMTFLTGMETAPAARVSLGASRVYDLPNRDGNSIQFTISFCLSSFMTFLTGMETDR